MTWKCENCGQKLSGKEKYCPNCATKAVYRCVKCGKELDSGRKKYCSVCNTMRSEERVDAVKKAVGVVATAGSVVLTVATMGKIKKS